MEFPELLNHHGIEFKRHGQHHHTSEGWINLDCPFCSPKGKKFRLGYNLHTRAVNCHACGVHKLWELIFALTEETNSGIRQIITNLPQKEIARSERTGNKVVYPYGIGLLHKFHIDYLLKRGYGMEILPQWEIQGIGQNGGLHRWSLFIPIYFRGEVVTWTTRSINPDTERRYRSALLQDSKISINDVLYGSDYVTNSVIVCEGPLDVWKIGPGAVALCGLGMSPARMDFLSRIPNRYVCLDAEPTAQKRAKQLCDNLSVFFGSTTNIVLESGKDPGECKQKELQELRSLLK